MSAFNITMPQGSSPLTASFTCNTCGIKFPTAELQRQHMKTDWHRYNLKRRVAQLPAIPSDTFAELVLSKLQQLADSQQLPDEDEYGFAINHRKTKSGARQLTKKDLKRQQHRGRPLVQLVDVSGGRDSSAAPSIQSIHSEFSEFSINSATTDGIERKSTNYSTSSEYDFTDVSHGEYTEEEDDYEEEEDDGDDEDLASDSELDSDSYDDLEEEIIITNCFFCGLKHNEREDNIKHMFHKHGLYIPERSYLVDIDGLLQFIGEVIIDYKECLSCGFLGKNLESIRQHMKSKGHCRIPYETKDEKRVISEFYNFNVESKKKKQKESNGKAVAFGDFEVINEVDREEKENDEEEEEEEEEVSDEDYDEENNYSVVQIDPTGVELTLPTGSRIGHRSMTRYYRQNLALPRDLSESERTLAATDRRFAPGLTVKEVSKQEKLTRRVEQRSKNEFYRKDKSSQINFQRHFRDVLLGPM